MKVRIYIAPTVTELTEFLARLPAERKNVIFCEDRLTLEAERAVAAAQGAVFDTQVTTFARFLSGKYARKALSKQGSVMVVGALAASHAARLKCFGKNPAGCTGRLYETIAQLRSALVSPEMLEEAGRNADRALAEKLADIALIYREYLAFLDGGYVDESGILSLLPEEIGKGALRGAHAVFAGFASFTRQAAEGIFAACRAAESVCGVFLGGEEDIYTNEAADDFEKYCRRAGAECERAFLPSSLCAEAEALRRCLFDPSYPKRVATDRVRVFEAADREDELAFIAAMIKSEVLDRGMRYRDMTVLLSDVNDYSVRLEKAFGEYGIPYYTDAKKSLAQHPLAKFVLAWLACVAEGFDPADADAFAGNEFFGTDRRTREEFRNYLLKYANYRGGVKRPIKEEAKAPLMLYAARERFLSAFDGASASMPGGRYCALLRRLLEKFECEAVQEKIVSDLAKAGAIAESEYFSKGCEGVMRVLGELEELSGDLKLRAEEFAAVLGGGLEGLEISLIPQYLDAVFVGDIAQSKKSASKVVFAARMTDAVPACGADTALISDRDIDRLRLLQVEISPKIRDVNARSRENAGLAVCGFSERLYLSYPLALGGEECRRSEIVDTALALFGNADGRPISVLDRAALERSERTNAAAYLRYLGCVASETAPAVRELLARADRYRRGQSDFGAHAGLLAALKERGDAPERLLFGESGPEVFVPSAANLVFRGKNTVAPTVIEGYFNCPYRNFAERGLLLREREEASVRPTDTGNFMHDVLRALAEEYASLRDERECAAFVQAKAEELVKEPPYCYLYDTEKGGYSAAAIVEEAKIVGANMFEQLKNSDFRVLAAEESFGYPSSAFPGIPLLSEGRRIFLAGRIDRVDSCGDYMRVIDYKTGAFDTSAENYYTGRKLQLELYLAAVTRGKRAAGAYYFPARAAFHSKETDSPFRLQGFTVGDDSVVRMSDKTVEEGQKSRYIDAYYRGRKSRKNMSEEDFGAFIAYSVLAAQNCARETEAGCIAASPYEGACDYCPYGGVCGYDRSEGARAEEKVTGEEIVRIVKKRRGEA